MMPLRVGLCVKDSKATIEELKYVIRNVIRSIDKTTKKALLY